MPLHERRVHPVVNHRLRGQAFRPWIRQAESTNRYQTGIEGMALKRREVRGQSAAAKIRQGRR